MDLVKNEDAGSNNNERRNERLQKERSKDGNHPRYRLAAAMRQKPQVVCMKRSAVPYIATLFSVLLALVALIVCWGLIGRDHFAAIRSGHGPTWYQDLGGDAVTEI